jgi:hypothetical protein
MSPRTLLIGNDCLIFASYIADSCHCVLQSGQALSLRPDLLRNKIWAEELGKLVDAVGSFSDKEAMRIMKGELADLYPRLKVTKSTWKGTSKPKAKTGGKRLTSVERYVERDPILSLFEFYNDNKAIASASIGQVYKAKGMWLYTISCCILFHSFSINMTCFLLPMMVP